MFTTGHHIYLYLTAGCYAAAFLFCCFKAKKPGIFLLISGLILHSLYLMGRGWIGGVFLPNPVVEGPFFLPWCIAVIAIVISLKKPDAPVNGIIELAFVFTLFALWYAKGIIPPTPKKVSTWPILFFMSESMAHALFYSGAVFGIYTLMRKQNADVYSFIVWGFVFYTIAQVTGAVWSYKGWGNTFNWSSRHLGSATIWTLYAAFLHVKFLPGWADRKKAVFAVCAAILVLLISYTSYLNEMTFPRIGG